MEAEKSVLIAIVNNGRDLHIANTEHWYRIPVKSAPKELDRMRYIAFYLTSAFGEKKWSINQWAEINEISIAKRSDLLPHEIDHPRSDELYFKLNINELKYLPNSIISNRGRRIVFITTTLSKFKAAKELNDLFHESPLEDKLWYEFKKSKIDAERQYYIAEEKVNYCLDFAIFCKDGNIDAECDGDTWHIQREIAISDNERNNFLASRGWSILRFTGKQINEMMPDCVEQVKYTIDRLGGIVTPDGNILRINENDPNTPKQLDLFKPND